MAKFLNGPGVQASLADLIRDTNKELFIISPYLKISQLLKNYIISIDTKNVPINLIYRSDFKINDDDMKFFKNLNNLNLFYCDNLHTKCYLNENMGIISTMNLHEHSQTHNWEMGILFSKSADADLYSDVSKELRSMGPLLKKHTFAKTVAEPKQKYTAEPAKKAPQKTPYKPTEAPKKGTFGLVIDKVFGEEAHCIRCGKETGKYDLKHPFCGSCYHDWAKHGKGTSPEKFCHACGKPKPSISFAKPICYDCYKGFYKK